MDSGLEAFLRKHEKAPEDKGRKLRVSKQAKYLAAENLANTIVKKREALEARSNLFNAGPMHVSGTGVHYQAASSKSSLPHTNPGLQQMRIHELKRRGPNENEKHHLRTHELLSKIAENTSKSEDPVGRGAGAGVMAGGSGGVAKASPFKKAAAGLGDMSLYSYAKGLPHAITSTSAAKMKKDFPGWTREDFLARSNLVEAGTHTKHTATKEINRRKGR